MADNVDNVWCGNYVLSHNILNRKPTEMNDSWSEELANAVVQLMNALVQLGQLF